MLECSIYLFRKSFEFDILFSMKIGYARVSTKAQNLDRQIAALRKAGCEKIFREKISGQTGRKRPQLEKAIDQMTEDDVFIVAEWNRATRSMMDGIKILQRIADRGAVVKVLDKPFLDLSTPMGKGFLAFLSALAEDERERILKTANEGRQEAMNKGVKFGRKPKLTEHQKATCLERRENGDSARSIAKDMGVAPATITRLR